MPDTRQKSNDGSRSELATRPAKKCKTSEQQRSKKVPPSEVAHKERTPGAASTPTIETPAYCMPRQHELRTPKPKENEAAVSAVGSTLVALFAERLRGFWTKLLNSRDSWANACTGYADGGDGGAFCRAVRGTMKGDHRTQAFGHGDIVAVYTGGYLKLSPCELCELDAAFRASLFGQAHADWDMFDVIRAIFHHAMMNRELWSEGKRTRARTKHAPVPRTPHRPHSPVISSRLDAHICSTHAARLCPANRYLRWVLLRHAALRDGHQGRAAHGR